MAMQLSGSGRLKIAVNNFSMCCQGHGDSLKANKCDGLVHRTVCLICRLALARVNILEDTGCVGVYGGFIIFVISLYLGNEGRGLAISQRYN